ncbi:hypothetical protein SD77_3610 [Bacillus badius]|uniref:Uncharacterized protein n=1 Tax=Bacillus badius TaxID=1455 RepID=A0ABR5ANH3_BACBA|nr:hypothetical protein SD77_3610 [Bacillus badius]
MLQALFFRGVNPSSPEIFKVYRWALREIDLQEHKEKLSP